MERVTKYMEVEVYEVPILKINCITQTQTRCNKYTIVMSF
jgi:hypothetical protein